MDEVEKLLQGMAEKAFTEDVWAELRADFFNYGHICYRITDAGEVVRIDPATIYLDTDS